ncbi:MAG: hypothetical protein RIT02_3429 [Planctomycetota bacterium]
MRIHKLALALSAVLISGCGGQYSPQAEIFKTVSASGVLTFRGKPLAGFIVTLHPAGDQRTASGTTDADGRFTLGTNAHGDGAVAGNHKVSVIWQPPEDDGLGSTVEDPKKMPKPPLDIPAKYASPETSEITLEIPESGSSDLKLDLN